MSKTIKRCFDEKLTFQKLVEAYERAKRGKGLKREILLFEMDLETNLIALFKELKDGSYLFGKYREFIVKEPKERLIRSLPFRDRIVHQWYVEEFIKPYVFPRMIKDTYACIDGRGTHKAVFAVQKYMRRMQKRYGNYIILQCDIKKFFYSIDKDILYSILKKKISDLKLLSFTRCILEDGMEKGIAIGNYTSQYFANLYLNELDHYVKGELRILYYVRYMDDFVILLEDKAGARGIKSEITTFLKEKLGLELNQKSRYFPSYLGINFCGYRIFETHLLLRKRFKKQWKKKILLWKKLREKEEFDLKKVYCCFFSFLAHAKYANSYTFCCKMQNLMMFFLNT